MSDLLATLLSGIGAGAQQYGKGLGERAMADQEEKKAMQRTLKMQAIKDGMNYEKQRALISATRPDLLDTYDRVTHQSGILRPLDDSDLKMLDQHLSAKKAQEQLDAMSVRPETQSMMGNAARQAGMDSPLGVTPQTPTDEKVYQMDYSTFADPAQREANQQMQSDNPPSMNRMGMSDASMGSSLATAVDIYIKKKMQAEQNRQVLTDKNEIESRKRFAAAGIDRPDQSKILDDQEIYRAYQSEINYWRSQHEQDMNRYYSALEKYNNEKAQLEADTYVDEKTGETKIREKSKKKLMGLRPPNPPLANPMLLSHQKDEAGSMRLFADRQRRAFGGINKPIETGGGKKLTKEQARQMLIDRGVSIE